MSSKVGHCVQRVVCCDFAYVPLSHASFAFFRFSFDSIFAAQLPSTTSTGCTTLSTRNKQIYRPWKAQKVVYSVRLAQLSAQQLQKMQWEIKILKIIAFMQCKCDQRPMSWKSRRIPNGNYCTVNMVVFDSFKTAGKKYSERENVKCKY